MLLKYPTFFFRFGIRKPDQLAKPPLGRLENLDFPQGSVYHYLGTSDSDDGPVDTLPGLDGYSKLFPTKQIFEVPTTLGNPRKLTFNAEQLFVRPWRLKNQRFRPFVSYEVADRDPQQLVVYNYSLIARMYRYMRSFYAGYHKLYNHQAALWHTLAQDCRLSQRQHFIEIALPQQLPSVSILRNAEVDITRKAIPFFSTMESMLILELWRWLGSNRNISLISKIPEDQLSKINLVFTDSGRWMLVNLGLLDRWRLPSRSEEQLFQEKGLELKGRVFRPDVFQRRLLHILLLQTQARVEDIQEESAQGAGPETAADRVTETTSQETTPNAVTQTTVTDELSGPTKNLTITKPSIQARIKTVGDLNSSIPEFFDDDFPVDASDQELNELLNTTDVHGIDNKTAGNSYEQVLADLEKLEDMTELSQLNEDAPVNDSAPVVDVAKTPEQAIVDVCNQLAETGSIPALEYKRFTDQAGAYRDIEAPDGSKLGDFIQIPKELVQISDPPKIPDMPTVLDKTMLESSLMEFDSKYVKDVLQKDVAAMVINLQQAGILVQNYEVEEIDDVTGSYYAYKVKIKPIQGTSSTLTFNLPKVSPNGTYRVNGVTYHQRKQFGDLPIRKLNPSRVALTSYYGKVFVDRSEKKVNDYGRWLRDNVMRMGLDPENEIVTELVPGDVFNHEIENLPRLYTILAQGFRSFNLQIIEDNKSRTYHLNLNYSQRYLLIPQSADRESDAASAQSEIEKIEEVTSCVVVGYCEDGNFLLVNSDALYRYNPKVGEDSLVQQSDIEDILDLRALRIPIDQVDISLYGKSIPSGVVLGYLLGLRKLCARLNVRPRVVAPGDKVGLQPDEWSVVFKDQTWVFSRKNALASIILAGWRDFEETTRSYNVSEFDRKNVYLNLMEENGLGVRHLREITLVNQLFIDPITRGLLEQMKEPQVMTELFIRGAEMLLTDNHPHELDARYMRIKGYERFPGIVYSEIVRSVRAQRGRANRTAYPVEMNPYAVWIAISEDSAKNQVSEINPIMDLKINEAVTYAGHGGRMSRSMVKRTRAYHPSAMGSVSEATVDASDVAINVSLSANPQFNSLRGTTFPFDLENPNTTSLFSTSALLAPSANKDDPKRVNFISIQNGHGVACVGYHQPQIRTGYEKVIGHRTSDLYCSTAKKPGKVVNKSDTGLIVEFSDGERLGIELGRRYGAAAGLTIPHEIMSPLKVDDEFAVGDVLAYNTGFFEPDFLNPRQVIFKMSMSVKTVLMESSGTLEDSSEISSRLARKLTTRSTKVRNIVVPFNANVHRLVKAGDRVEYESILCLIEDAVSAQSNLLDKESLDTLKVLSHQHLPHAKLRGVVERIEVYYNGDIEDMSETLQELTVASDKALAKRFRASGRPVFSGSTSSNFRIDNEPLLMDTAVIRIYITADVAAGVGDKGVFGNQLKTVFGRVFDTIKTESGTQIDAIFGAKSVDDRIVTSPFTIGTATTLLNVIANKMVKAYRG